MSKTTYAILYIGESMLKTARADSLNSISCNGKIRSNKQEFFFHKVFPSTVTQADIFEELFLLVQSALEGYNVCVFAYKQTDSGKTYPMEGGNNLKIESVVIIFKSKGMIPRTVQHIFAPMKEFELLGCKYKIEANFLEIYNEHIADLLDSQQKIHEIRIVDSKGTDLHVTNLQIEEIYSPEELHSCLRVAQSNFTAAATQFHNRSSRSHCITNLSYWDSQRQKSIIYQKSAFGWLGRTRATEKRSCANL